MRMGILAGIALAASVATGEARVWVGSAASFQGATVLLRGKLFARSSTGLTGTLRCRVPKRSVGYCLGKRGDVVIDFRPNGLVEATLIFRNAGGVLCAAIGEGSIAAGIVAHYGCAAAGELLDQGTLVLAPR